ncbi:hypothetical protein DFH06DRAFT_1478838 [Mycena polygramma]|nr:hypothetical protein DFH06DRAFT_1478838 [Mycena polygramma]
MTVLCQKCGHRPVNAFRLVSRNYVSPPTEVYESPESSSPFHPPQLRADLEAVDVEILRHQAILSELDARRQSLEHDLARICLPAHGRIRPSPVTPPLLLTQVCRDWREIALSTCELWCSVDVASTKVGYEKELPTDSALTLIDTWFSRAKAQPLSLAIRPVHPEISTPLMPLILSASTRFHTLELRLSKEDFDILEQDNTAFPGLRRLALVSSVDCHPRSILERVPLLKELVVESLPTIKLPPSLTKLEIRRRITFATVLDVIRQCPLLMELIAGVSDRPRLSDGPPPITLPHLESLVIRGTHVHFLTLPALRRLDIINSYTLLALVARSNCVLQHLSIEYPNPCSKLPTILRAVPSLTSLTLEVDRFMDQLAEILEQDPTLLPLLTTLRLSAWHRAFDFVALIQILRERYAPSPTRARLTFVKLTLKSDVDEGEKYWLPRSAAIEFDKLVAQGLTFQGIFNYGRTPSYVWPKGSTDPCESFP